MFEVDLDLEPTTTAAPPAPPQLARPSLPELPSKPELLFETRASETWVGTLPARRKREERRSLAKLLALPAIACIAAGVGLGLYLNANKSKATPSTSASQPTPSTTSTAPTPSAPQSETVRHPKAPSLESSNAGTSTAGGEQPQPPTKDEQAAQMAAAAAGESGTLTHDAPAEAVAGIHEVQTPKGVIKLTDVRIDTTPAGASITLVDRGKQFPLGSTPLSTSLDTSRQYDVIIEMAGRPSQMVHLDPSTTSRLDVSLARKQAAAAPSAPAVEKKAPVAKIEDSVEKPAAVKAEKPAKVEAPKTEKAAKSETPKAEKAEKAEKAAKTEKSSAIADPFESTDAAPAAPVADGPGVLMLSSKPPCEILVDGKSTGLTTPQPSLEVPAGRHKITFLNSELGIKETFTVIVKAGEPTKLIKDFLDRK
jgi:hypothetical protein